MPRMYRAVVVIVAIVTLSGCTVFDKKNRVLLNKLDDAAADSFLTRSLTARIAAAPVAVPVGVAAGVLDLAVVTPARQVVPSYKNTKEMVWDNPQGSDFRQAVLFLPKVVATPLVYATTWTVRSFFFND